MVIECDSVSPLGSASEQVILASSHGTKDQFRKKLIIDTDPGIGKYITF